MADTPINTTPEPEYGDKGQAEAQAEAIELSGQAQAAEDAEMQALAMPMAEGEGYGSFPQAPGQGVTVKNPYMLMPPSSNFPEGPQKSQVEQDFDIGRLWRVLAEDSKSSPLTKMIAKMLTTPRMR